MANTFMSLTHKVMQTQAAMVLRSAGESIARQMVNSFEDSHSSVSGAENESLYKSSSLEPNESSQQELDYMIGGIKKWVSYSY